MRDLLKNARAALRNDENLGEELRAKLLDSTRVYTSTEMDDDSMREANVNVRCWSPTLPTGVELRLWFYYRTRYHSVEYRVTVDWRPLLSPGSVGALRSEEKGYRKLVSNGFLGAPSLDDDEADLCKTQARSRTMIAPGGRPLRSPKSANVFLDLRFTRGS